MKKEKKNLLAVWLPRNLTSQMTRMKSAPVSSSQSFSNSDPLNSNSKPLGNLQWLLLLALFSSLLYSSSPLYAIAPRFAPLRARGFLWRCITKRCARTAPNLSSIISLRYLIMASSQSWISIWSLMVTLEFVPMEPSPARFSFFLFSLPFSDPSAFEISPFFLHLGTRNEL